MIVYCRQPASTADSPDGTMTLASSLVTK